jgi:hypothetical protein
MSSGAGGTLGGGTGGTSSGADATPGGSGKTDSAAAKSSAASAPIPEPPQHRYRIYGAYYPEVDHYVLEGMNIPGTDLCVAGDQLRTRGPITITELKTDHTKCRIRTRGDEEKEICPPGARSQVVVFRGYLAVPLSYQVNTCRKYDTSHCRIIGLGTDREREYCRVNFKYEGLWVADTVFEYRCTHSEIVTHRHPLEYNIRYIVEVERNDRIISREIHRIKQSIPLCH